MVKFLIGVAIGAGLTYLVAVRPHATVNAVGGVINGAGSAASEQRADDNRTPDTTRKH